MADPTAERAADPFGSELRPSVREAAPLLGELFDPADAFAMRTRLEAILARA